MVKIVKLIDPLQIVNIPSGLVPKGAYDNGVDYAVGDSVDYQGSSYVMFANAGAGTLPTNTTYWQVLANKGATGATGAQGEPGSSGSSTPGGDSFIWEYDNETTMSDPGAGKLRLDNTDLTLAENVMVDPVDASAVDLTTWITSIDTPTNKGIIKIYQQNDPTKFFILNISDVSDETGYFRFAGSYVDSNGSFTNGADLVLTFAPSGQNGTNGPIWDGNWSLTTEYVTSRIVYNDGSSYICTSAHTATADDEPGTGVNWTDYWQLVAQGGSGATGSFTTVDLKTVTVVNGLITAIES